MSGSKDDPFVIGPESDNLFSSRPPNPGDASSSSITIRRPPFLGEPPSNDSPFVIESKPNNPVQAASKGKKTLAQLAEQQILEQLKEAVKGYQSTASYCCGGNIPISTSPDESPFATTANLENPITAPPVAFRWDVSGHGSARTIHFPFTEGHNLRNTTLFNELLQSCAPATFGRKDEDILDESYRKAGKLDRSQFSVDFHPHDYGIVDAISQILLPEISTGFLKDREEHRGVVAELYKLNIYSGPAGKFRSHVDTPRGETQFGSLVVCLPYRHEGGQLRVTHKGHTKYFDCCKVDSAAIQWAAFYSDCEHEVLPVTSGHRITLTYNLYVTQQIGSVLQRYPTADPALSPLYTGAKEMLAQPNFMAEGGTLAFFCSHSYAHHRSSPSPSTLLPFALKGIDMTLFTIFRSFGLSVSVRPMLDPNDDQLSRMNEYRAEDEAEETGEPVDNEEMFWIDEEFRETALLGGGGFEDLGWMEEEEMIQDGFPHTLRSNLTWLNSTTGPYPRRSSGKGWDVALARMTYGNQAELTWHYSHAVILIEIPKRERPSF